MIGWHHPVYWAQDKIDAFRKTLALHGRSAQVFQPSARERDDITGLQRRLQKWILQLPRPCGVFGVNDLVCEIALSAATALEIAVPEDLAFVGADDDPLICETTIPSLTSVQPDFFQTGLVAAELLAERMEDPSHGQDPLPAPDLQPEAGNQRSETMARVSRCRPGRRTNGTESGPRATRYRTISTEPAPPVSFNVPMRKFAGVVSETDALCAATPTWNASVKRSPSNARSAKTTQPSVGVW